MKLFSIERTTECHVTIWYYRAFLGGRWQHTKCFGIGWLYKWWSKNGTGPKWGYRDNGAKKSQGDTCLDQTLSIGYLILNHVNWNLQKRK
jgi:hypothetical protein